MQLYVSTSSCEHAQPLPLRAPSTIALHLLQYVNSPWAGRLLLSHREHDFLRAFLCFHIIDDFASEKVYTGMNSLVLNIQNCSHAQKHREVHASSFPLITAKH